MVLNLERVGEKIDEQMTKKVLLKKLMYYEP